MGDEFGVVPSDDAGRSESRAERNAPWGSHVDSPSPADGLAPVLGLVRSLAGDVNVLGAERVGTASRNRLIRLRMSPGIPDKSLIVKEASLGSDSFFAHHLRREERVLDLLDRFAPGLAPRCYGLILACGQRGWLVLEDVGEESLADRLARLDSASAIAALAGALAGVRRLHAALREHRQAFYRTCYAVDLDRFSAATVRSRFKVAWRRIAEAACVSPEAPISALRAWSHTLEPLVSAPRQMIHNSLSPLNIVVGEAERPRIVDFETMALGPACIDVAELLRQPYAPIDWQTTARLACACDRDLALLRLASVARSVDYAGSNARQLRHLEGRSAAEEHSLRRRLQWYVREARELIHGNQALHPLDDLLAAVERSS